MSETIDKRSAKEIAEANLIQNIHAAVQMEGYETDAITVHRVLNGEPANKLTFEEITFMHNQKVAWEYILHTPELAISTALLQKLNILACDRISSSSGEFREHYMDILGTDWFPGGVDLKKFGIDLERVLSIADPLTKALRCACLIAREHPFYDGSKRVAGFAANIILLQHNIGVLCIPVGMIQRFYKLLLDYYESDSSLILEHFIKSNCIQYAYAFIMHTLAGYFKEQGILDPENQVEWLEDKANGEENLQKVFRNMVADGTIL